MASFKICYDVVMKHEGGYANPVGISGETYKGIDRKHNEHWQGWQIVDAFKRAKGGYVKNGTIIVNSRLDDAVVSFYRNYFLPLIDIESIWSQDLANFVFDFFTHKQYDAVKVFNTTAKQVFNIPHQLPTTKVPADVIEQQVNPWDETFYRAFFKNRIEYYKNPATFGSSLKFSTKFQNIFIERVQKFPPEIDSSLWKWFFGIFDF